ncbi:MAG: hypothetical protein O4861_06170 [Trichodesmium sp. St16_bin4-tuft]|nr:hypothetical protein [Trichodesmium sp. MAG_R01]MDE5069365.1 hypothetical protein [Trichodesmium sp. St4_bin8_1]MDE5097944.1 hypothetical protein [Trichodesmium sp. St16_bin4-tuft]MDE5104616.1 hypothetical protein [Trichodesmium sp. St19_bin2]
MKLETTSQTQPTESQLRVLHLRGSPVSEFYYNLSIMYARDMVNLIVVSSYYVVVHPESL